LRIREIRDLIDDFRDAEWLSSFELALRYFSRALACRETCSFPILEVESAPLISGATTRDKLNIDSTLPPLPPPPARTRKLGRPMNMLRASIKINASIRTDSAIGALMRRMLCVNAHGDEDKYLY